MRQSLIILSFIAGALVFLSFINENERIAGNKLRKLYSRSPGKWPAPSVDEAVQWNELGILPGSPLEQQKDSLKQLIELGKILFFDTRLSGSGKISCATCHKPELNWTDGKERSAGHEGALNKRNAPSIQNSWFYKALFWDGRSRSLQDQAFAPVNSETEMHSEMHEVMRKLSTIKEYHRLFKLAFGDEDIDPFRMTEAIATFEKTIISRKSRFDEFLEGKKEALSNAELRGLHLFRTKARCMNCHNGPMFSDNQFHNNGFHLDGDPENDKGLYMVTHKEEDIGKFKTPSLRDVMRTGPWMHQGSMKTISEILIHYNKGSKGMKGNDLLIKALFLSEKEQADLEAFLNAISSPPLEFNKPVIP